MADGAGKSTEERLWRLTLPSFTAVLAAGALLAVRQEDAAAWLLVFGLAGLVTSHLVLALRHYRRTMARPWPAVAPLPADDDC